MMDGIVAAIGLAASMLAASAPNVAPECAAKPGGAADSSAGEAVQSGEALYERRCGGCHSLDHNRVGPKHRDVYGRRAGTAPGFRYSRALKALDVVWTEATLDPWLENPTKFAPGTAMGFRLADANERLVIIRYLKSVSPQQADEPCKP